MILQQNVSLVIMLCPTVAVCGKEESTAYWLPETEALTGKNDLQWSVISEQRVSTSLVKRIISVKLVELNKGKI